MKGDNYSGIVIENKLGFSDSDKQLIAENVKRILTTRKGERVNEPDFGSNILDYLFLPQMYVSDLVDEIKSSIESQEPRVKVTTCTLVSANQDDEITIRLGLKLVDSSSINVEVNV